jgi:curved DNA-binding protein CbpA
MRYHAALTSLTFATILKAAHCMKGYLTEHPLVELIREILIKGLSGTLRLKRDPAQAAVYFETGNLVFAASNLRTLRLRPYLEQHTHLTAQELDRLGSNLTDSALAAGLVNKGIMAREQVEVLLASVVSDVLRVVLLWTDAEWEFDERARFNETMRVRVDVPNLLREAAHRLPLQLASSRFRNQNESLSRVAKVSKVKDFLPAESFILSRLDAPMKLSELVAVSGLRDLDAQRTIYALSLSGFVARENWQNAFRGDIKKQGQTAASMLVASEFEKPVDESDLKLFLSRIGEAKDHYEILDLGVKAAASEVKDAYYSLARRYHPDRFHLKSGTALHTQLSSAFARVTQAYETLNDAAARRTYDASLERVRQFQQAAAAKAAEENFVFDPGDLDDSSTPEQNYRDGLEALKQGRINAAMNHLAAAARAMPNEARYRAYYGKALAATDRTRRLAENELQSAVQLDPRNARYRVMLADLFFELKFQRRAQTEVERALALDPNNSAAAALLKKLQKSRKTG